MTARPCYIIAEIGINHKGSLDTALDMVAAAKAAGCDAVKYQKRTIGIVYTQEELDRPRESVFGHTNYDLKVGLELGLDYYWAIDECCRRLGIDWFASCWDKPSIDFINSFNPPYFKIAIATLTDDRLLKATRKKGRPIMLSTGMSTLEQIDHAVEVLGKDDLILLHCCSAYPAHNDELNLCVIQTLRERYGSSCGLQRARS